MGSTKLTPVVRAACPSWGVKVLVRGSDENGVQYVEEYAQAVVG
jgi:hypothetical protein